MASLFTCQTMLSLYQELEAFIEHQSYSKFPIPKAFKFYPNDALENGKVHLGLHINSISLFTNTFTFLLQISTSFSNPLTSIIIFLSFRSTIHEGGDLNR